MLTDVPRPDGEPRRRLTMPMACWHTIDGTLDNEVATAAPSLDPDSIVRPATAIREEGWRQLTGWTSYATPAPVGWPEPEAIVGVELSIEQWRLVARLLAKWRAVSQGIGHDTAHDDAVLAVITSALEP